MHARLRLAGVALALTSTALITAPAGAAPPHKVLHGTFTETAVGAASPFHYDIHGSAKLTVSAGSTVAKINVSGLDPAKHYSSHVHNGTCAAPALGGGHYQNVEGGATTPPNELHLSNNATTGAVDPNKGGVAHASGSAPWAARLTSATQTNAKSIVVHEPGGARIACANLT